MVSLKYNFSKKGNKITESVPWEASFWSQIFFIMALVDVFIIFIRKSFSVAAAITPSIEVLLGITILSLRKHEKVVRVCLMCLFFLTGIVMLPGGDLKCIRDLGEEGVLIQALGFLFLEFMAAAGIAILFKYFLRSNCHRS